MRISDWSSDGCSSDLPIAAPARAPDWADEFDTPGLPDPAKWAYDTAWNKQGWFNDEKQYYAADRPQNARVEDGTLLITARRDGARDQRLLHVGEPEGLCALRPVYPERRRSEEHTSELQSLMRN